MVNKALVIALVILLIGALFVLIQTNSGGSSSGGGETPSAPAACAAGYFVTQVNESSAGAIGYHCTQNPGEAASTPAACATHFVVNQVAESSAGVVSYNCIQLSYADLTGHVGTANETASTPSACGAGNYQYQTGESAGGVISYSCKPPTNMAFASNTKSCTDTTQSTQKMMGFKANYTTQAANFLHTITVTLNFQLQPPSSVPVIATNYWLTYGSGNAPACNAAATGTKVGNEYAYQEGSSFNGYVPLSETVSISGLSASTAYWFDVTISDSSTASWAYSEPQISVVED